MDKARTRNVSRWALPRPPKSVPHLKDFLKTLAAALRGTEQEFTTGSVDRALFLLAVPMVLEMLGEGLFAVVDAWFVGRIGPAAMTTVGLTETVATLIYSLAIGLSIAVTAVVARRMGEGNPEAAARAGAQAMWIGLGLSALIAILGVTFAPDILRLMGADAEVIATGVDFTRILFGTNFVIMGLFVLNGIFRGAGDASMAMRSLWIANLLNIVLDPLFIFGLGPFPELGVTGAAVATSIGRGVGVAFQLYVLFRGTKLIRIARRHLRVVPETLKSITDIASTGALQFLISSSSWIVIAPILAGFGTDVYAGFFAAIRVIIFAILPAWGLSNAAATLVGQNLGAHQPERAERSVERALLANVIFLGSLGILLYFFADPIIAQFVDDPISQAVGVEALHILSIGYVAYGIGMVINQSFGGAGDTRTPTWINFFTFWLLEIPLAYVLALHFDWGPSGVFWGIVLAESAMAVVCLVLFRRGRWKTVMV